MVCHLPTRSQLKITTMKSIFYFAAMLMIGNASAQMCNYIIAPHAEVGGVGNIHITSDTTILSNDGSNFYICSGVTMVINYSAGSNYELEDGVTLTINDHAGDNVAAKGNCTIIDNSVESIVVTKEASSTFSKPNMPLGAVIFTCANMVFDYAQVGGSSPCSTASLESDNELGKFNIYPNPLKGSTELNFGVEVSDIKIFDLTGRMVADYQNVNNTSFKLDINSGVFFVQAILVSGLIRSSRLIVE